MMRSENVEFDLSFFDGEEEIKYGERPHTSISAVSPGLKVTVVGRDTEAMQRRQMKPAHSEGIYRNMLWVKVDDVFVHVLGDHVVIAREKLRIGQIAPGLKDDSR